MGSLVRCAPGLSRTFATKRKCATEEMAVVCFPASEKVLKNSLISFRETIEWE
jgi:hypothetical protein